MTMNSDRPTLGTSSAIEVTSTMVVPTTIRIVALNRPGVGASSGGRRSSHACGAVTVRAGAAVVMACTSVSEARRLSLARSRRNQRNRGGADTEELGRGVLDADAHREALRHAHPVD